MTNAILEKLWNINLANTEILDVSHEESEFWDITDVPAFTRVHWKNSYGEDSVILSEIWMPDDWNGRFVVCGSGGMAGVLARPLIAVYARLGYAAAHTNMGTGNGRPRGIGNPDVWNAERESKGTIFLLVVISAATSAFSATLPVNSGNLVRKSTNIRWLSVPPETIL